MAYDPSFGAGQDGENQPSNNIKNSMSGTEQNLEFGDLYQNEESIDLSSYMTPQNLDLCDDDLFQSLFPTGDLNVKKEHQDPLDLEVEWWNKDYNQSACSSAAPSPTPQFYNTPPVTPKSDVYSVNQTKPTFIDPNLLNHQPGLGQQLQQDSLSNFSMSATRYTPITGDETPQKLSIVPITSPLKAKAIRMPIRIKPDPDGRSENISVSEHFDHNNNDVTEEWSRMQNVQTAVIPKTIDGQSYNHNNLKRVHSDDSITTNLKKARGVPKDSEEYRLKRERNNVAVRKSRDKAKIKAQETAQKVTELSNENKRLRERVNELTHELNTLKGILKSLPQQQQTGA